MNFTPTLPTVFGKNKMKQYNEEIVTQVPCHSRAKSYDNNVLIKIIDKQH